MNFVWLILVSCALPWHKYQLTRASEIISLFDSMSEFADQLRNHLYNISSPPISSPAASNSRMNKLPLSLSILMNFDQYGTSSVQLADNNGVLWSDSCTCPHGQTYDPYKYVCRDMFCLEGYVLGPNGCSPDPERDLDSTNSSTSSVIYPDKLLVELTISHKMCLYIVDLNTTVPCSHPYLIDLASESDLSDDWVYNIGEEFLGVLGSKTNISRERFTDFAVVSREISKKAVTSFLEDFYDNNDLNLELPNGRKVQDFKRSSIDEKASSGKLRQTEKIRIKFRIMDKMTEEEFETLEVYFQLLMYGLSKETFVLFGRKTSVTNIIQSKSDENSAGWCENTGDLLHHYLDGFRILAAFGNRTRYFVYVNSTDTIYTTGYYYLFIMLTTSDNLNEIAFAQNNPKSRSNHQKTMSRYNPIEEEPDLNPWLIDYRQFNLTDVTEYMIANKTSAVKTYTLLATCDRAPKIRIYCANYTTIRVRICEFNYVPKNRSFCWPMVNKCYSVDEYEFDSEEPNRYLRICNFENADKVFILSGLLNNKKPTSSDFLVDQLPGYLSFILTLISTTLMIACLFTYALFSELRNIPGWTIINLTLAMSIAQVSFLASSYFGTTTPTLCFINSLSIHYGYLASFFWMNVIAFDLYRNFRDKASHVLIHSVTLKSRLPKYALYGWLAPMIVVATAVILDLSMMNISSPYRPCYAGFLPGCVIRTIPTEHAESDAHRTEESLPWDYTSCDDLKTPNYVSSNPLNSCWIRNGLANLIFFGLPIGAIILVNGIFYSITVFNVRKKQRAHRRSQLRRFTRAKLPSQVKFYTQMGIIMGFTWISGFLITVTSHTEYRIFNLILTYFFLVLNSSTGLFIFLAFICREEVAQLYMRRFGAIFYGAEYKTKSAQIQQQLQQQQQQQQQSQRRLQKEQQSFDADNKPPQIKITRQITLDPSELDSNLVMRRSSNSMKTINTDVEFSNVMPYDNYETSKTDQDF